MAGAAAHRISRGFTIRSPIIFILVAFLASYSLAFGLMFAGANQWLVNAGAVSGPTIAAIVALRLEKRPLGEFLRDRLIAQVPGWHLLLLVPLMIALSLAALLLAGGSLDGFTANYASAPAYEIWAFNILVVALLEELGWRGYLTPRLLERMTPFAVSLIVGVVWALWHGPKLIGLPMLGVIALSLSFVMTYIVGTRKDGLAACILLHGSFNGAVMSLEVGSEFSHALGAFNIMGAAAALVALVLVISRARWFLARPEEPASA